MADLQEILALARALGPADREQLARALAASPPRPDLPLFQGPAPQSAAWLRAERGHAVVDTMSPAVEAAVPPGAEAIAGIWTLPALPPASGTPQRVGGPCLAATDLCLELAGGLPEALAFFQAGAAAIRLATPTYLELLALAGSAAERRRLQRFVSVYAVLSLGPVASGRSVELLLKHRERGLEPLQALAAATALAHEIPLLTRRPEPFAAIAELRVARPY